MAKFAHYYIKYNIDFAPHEWEKRQEHLRALFETNESIRFLSEEADKREFKHQVYHLNCAPDIIVMRLANNIDLPTEHDFKRDTTKDEPSCFVIIDNREGMRTVAIQRRRQTRWMPDDVARILTKAINSNLYSNYCYKFEILPEYYPEDLYSAWALLQQQMACIRFAAPDMSRSEIMARIQELKARQRQNLYDDSLIEPLLQLALEAKKANYKHFYTVMPEDRKFPLYVDKTSAFIRNLVTMAEATGEPVELVTSNGGTFRCFVDSSEDNTDKIIHREFDARLLELLFDARDKDGKKIEPDARIKAEGELLEMMNSMKHEARIEEEETAA